MPVVVPTQSAAVVINGDILTMLNVLPVWRREHLVLTLTISGDHELAAYSPTLSIIAHMSALDFNDDSRPSKRIRGDEYEDEERPNGHGERPLPPMSLSILGVEPLDEFIREIADFVYTLINEKPESLKGAIEVEARIGIIRDRNTGGRLALPVTCETGEYDLCLCQSDLKKLMLH